VNGSLRRRKSFDPTAKSRFGAALHGSRGVRCAEFWKSFSTKRGHGRIAWLSLNSQRRETQYITLGPVAAGSLQAHALVVSPFRMFMVYVVGGQQMAWSFYFPRTLDQPGSLSASGFPWKTGARRRERLPTFRICDSVRIETGAAPFAG